MKSADKNFSKKIFLLGDIHNLKLESSFGGKRVIFHVNQLLHHMSKESKSGGLSYIWESSSQLAGKQPKLYMLYKAREIYEKVPKGRFVFSDEMRNTNRVVNQFLRHLVYRPNRIASWLRQKKRRMIIARNLEGLIPRQGNLLERELDFCDQKKMSAAVHSALKHNIYWYRREVQHIIDSLKIPTYTLFDQENTVKLFRKVLVEKTADLELLVKTFSQDTDLVVVYAGNAHIQRIQSYLYRLNFVSSFQVEQKKFLSKMHVNEFSRYLQANYRVKSSSA